MAYDLIETSTDLGRQVFLYEFLLNDIHWYYTSSALDKLVNGQTYRYAPISDDGLKLSGDVSADALNITAPATIGPAQAFLGSPPSGTMYVRIRHMHEGDTEAPLIYAGEVVQMDLPEPGKVVIQVLPLSSLMQREGLRLVWQRTCPYSLYDQHTCKVAKWAHEIEATLTEVTADIVRSPAFASVPDGRLRGGFLEWISPVRGKEYRAINDHVGDTITIFGFTDGLYYGLKVSAFPGCDLTVETCRDVFDNLDNYGGVPHLQGKSPFDGTPVF